MIKLIITTLFLLSSQGLLAQYAYFATQGKISFDKITYTKARMKEMMANANSMGGSQGIFMRGAGGISDNIPESSTETYDFEFDNNQSVMKKSEDPAGTTPESQGDGRGRGRSGGGQRGGLQAGIQVYRGAGMGRRGRNDDSKVLYQNIQKQTAQIQLEIDEKFILDDSLSAITWRFTDEYRNIAGYECRRVNGATKDSLYLVAYYTDQIPVSGGPALVHGLPGMILGLVIPEMHVHYWATKVSYTTTPITSNWKDKKAKPMNFTDFAETFGRYYSGGRGDTNSNRRRILERLIY